VRGAGGRWRARFVGTDHDVAEGPELDALERLIEDHGYYRIGRARRARSAPGGRHHRGPVLELMTERLRAWMALADERLRPKETPIYVMLGNDDPPELRTILDEATWATPVEGVVTRLDEDHELVSWGYSNLTPFHSHREQTEPELADSIALMVGKLHDPARAVFNLHVPPIASGLDDAPVIDESLTVQASLGQVRFAPAGSTAVRAAIEATQPLLSLHGHIHESAAIRRIGQTIAINPGATTDRRADPAPVTSSATRWRPSARA
jgi:Icc-related predicted phosphoesterase